MALLTATALWLLRRLRASPRVAAGIVLVATILLVPFTGSAPPVVRSAAGFTLFLTGRLLGREPTGTTLLALVAAGYAVLDPGAGSDPGFRMSFAAAGGLMLLGPRIRRFLVREGARPPGTAPPRAPLRSALAAGLAAWMSSAPFAVAALGQAGVVAVPVGIVAVPLSTLILVGGAVASALADVPLVGAGAVSLVGWVIALLRGFLDLPERLGFPTGPVEDPGAGWYLAWMLALAGLACGGPRAALASVWALLVLLVALSTPGAPPAVEGVRLTLLDVGHGQAALLETSDGRRVLLDAGSRDRRDPADRIVLPALFALAASTLDLAVVSHADADHAGAVPEIADAIGIDDIVVPPRFGAAARARLASTGSRLIEAVDGDGLLAGPWGRLVVLGPERAPARRASRNDDGLVLAVETPWGAILLPGDREARGVARLIEAHPRLAARALVLPHHGHPGQGVETLVDAVRPDALLASTPSSTSRHLPAGTRSTGREGALVVTLGPAGLAVSAPFAESAARADEYDRAASSPETPMRDPLSLASAAAALAVVGWLATRLRWLTRAGAVGAVVLGMASVAAFGWPALAGLLAPFLAATLAGRLPGAPGDEGPRTLRQVASNGLVPFLGAVAGAFGLGTPARAVFLGGLAALGADTLATELGTRWGGTPRSLMSGRRLVPGESGGVTAVGLIASAFGSVLAPLAYALAAGAEAPGWAPLAAAGIAAGLADSALGAALQRKGRCASCGRIVEDRVHCGATPVLEPGRLAWLDNDAVNLANGVVGASLAVWWASTS